MRDGHESEAFRPWVPVARVFSPSDLDLEDLAEAIRQLLGPAIGVPEEAPNQPDPDLLLSARGATHVVVGENHTH